jgi:hypothetical protein
MAGGNEAAEGSGEAGWEEGVFVAIGTTLPAAADSWLNFSGAP